MSKAYTLQKQGSISDLKLINSELPDPADSEVQIKHTAIGINRFDLHHIVGDYKLKNVPAVLGIEACGVISKMGKGVKDFVVGDKVIYSTESKGSYSESRNIDARWIMIAPDKIPDDVLVALFSKGLTAQYLSRQVYFANKKSTVVVLGAAGGVGYVLCQYLKTTGAKVIAVVGSGEKKSFITNFGADFIIDHTSEDVVAKIREYSGGLGANCIYDCYGAGFLQNNIKATAPFGIIVNYGDVLGSLTNLNIMELWKKSLYIIRPSLFTYKVSNRVELVLSSALLFTHIIEGRIRPKINTYKFKEVPRALKDMQNNKLIGSVVVKI
ncbi:MAG: zinc-binding dehydrogenase [Rickettsiales bacterium]|jgi:NADPH:quinone reductase|nr:zinc-binding dehydrogenase [Rickettsiales bacterium]